MSLGSHTSRGLARELKRIDHQQAYSLDGVSTNWAESYFSHLRRGETGHHHHILGPYLLRFAQEAAWREDNRRVPNGDRVQRSAGAGPQEVGGLERLLAEAHCRMRSSVGPEQGLYPAG